MKGNEHFFIINTTKILIGFGILGLIIWKLPILELLWMFMYIVMIPATFMLSIGMISTGSYNLISATSPEIRNRINQEMTRRINKKLPEIREELTPEQGT